LAVINAALSGGGSFVNSYMQSGELVIVVVTTDSNGAVNDVSYFNASTGQPSTNGFGMSMNPNADQNQNLGAFLAANPSIAGTKFVNPYTPPPSN